MNTPFTQFPNTTNAARAPRCFSYRPFLRGLAVAALLCGVFLASSPIVLAKDSGALIELLVRKGILTSQEAEEVRADLLREAAEPPALATAGSSLTTRLRVSGRLQAQFASIGTDIAGTSADPAATNHFFARRLYLTARADLGPSWNSNLTYDFAGGLFDAAWVQYKGRAFSVDLGLRKVNLGLEERTSSGSLLAIERSGVTRYFVEENNGRRLGAGSYRVGVFVDGKSPSGKFFYGAAITNPERAVNSGAAASAGNGSRNQFALWANAGFSGRLGEALGGGSIVLGAGAGYLPDQGGRPTGTGNDLAVYTVYADLRGLAGGRLGLAAELLGADVERGVSATRDAQPWGYWVQPSLKLSEPFELVARYSALDSDGRGVSLSDGVRSAPGGGTHDKLRELFFGGNWYLRGNDLKLQLGYVYGESRGAVAGGSSAGKAKSQGVRSQLQLNF
ncbi:hypothetical protein AXK11_03260 [Cephaloticoccus primus]|uniref:Porin n=1 Tax=Cephaloticoccus primus TaxID=1548207 RepID=A0A139SQL1_9BACT|nr:porin [Cephaloticoccus primus]KXU36827.1 hypothetical protein AXK11_03260 [Cephaloticoccus primus]